MASGSEPTAEHVMPDLRGRTLRQALASLAPFGVHVDVRGRGRVVAQSPAPLAPLAAGLTARLDLVLTPPAPLVAAGAASRPRGEPSVSRTDRTPIRTTAAPGRTEGAITPALDSATPDR
jgi:hypothetical protein